MTETAREHGHCSQCEYDNINCWLRYYKDLLEYGGPIEWICPACGESHIKSDAGLACEHCGFFYECQ